MAASLVRADQNAKMLNPDDFDINPREVERVIMAAIEFQTGSTSIRSEDGQLVVPITLFLILFTCRESRAVRPRPSLHRPQ